MTKDIPHLYKLWGVVFSSMRAIPELRPMSDADAVPAWRIEFQPFGKVDGVSADLGTPEGFIQSERTEGGVRLAIEGPVLFDIPVTDRCIRVRSHPDVPEHTVTHLLLDHAIPRALAGWGEIVLHASAVVLPQGAVAFVAPSGGGKSTLAAAFGTRGHPILADDGLRIETTPDGLLGHPSYPGLRLWPDTTAALAPGAEVSPPVAHDTLKQRVSAHFPFADQPQRLLRCYFLEERLPQDADQAVVIERVGAADALIAWLGSLFHLDDSSAAIEAEFERVADPQLLETTRSLRYPSGRAALGRVVDAVRRDLRPPTGA